MTMTPLRTGLLLLLVGLAPTLAAEPMDPAPDSEDAPPYRLTAEDFRDFSRCPCQAGQLALIRQQLSDARSRLEALERKRDEWAPLVEDWQAQMVERERQTRGLEIALVNRSGVRRLAEQVATGLEALGHRVVAVHEERVDNPPWQSHLRYREDQGEAAVAIGHELPGVQVVTRAEQNMPEEAVITLLLGLDQLGKWTGE